MSSPHDVTSDAPPTNPTPGIQRLLFVSDAAVAGVEELQPVVRAIIDAATEVNILRPTLPGRLAWLADDVDRFRHREERGLIEHVEDRFHLPVTTFAVDPAAHTRTADGPVLLCYEGSEDAKHAIEQAGSVLGGRDALVVTVWQPTPAPGSTASAGATDSTVDSVEVDRANADLGERLARDGVRIAQQAGLRAKPVAIRATGPVWKTIVEIADRHDAAIIAMGSRGPTGLRPMLRRSVSSAIVHHADRPTLIIRQSTQQTGRSPH